MCTMSNTLCYQPMRRARMDLLSFRLKALRNQWLETAVLLEHPGPAPAVLRTYA